MSNARWAIHWNSYPTRYGPEDFLRQVGKTLNQAPVDTIHLERIIAAIAAALALQTSDSVLDLCCGNGLITARLAPRCGRVLGVDFSAPLIEVARRHHRPGNVTYLCSSVLELSVPIETAGAGKAWMYEALQHFDTAEAGQLLTGLASLAPPSGMQLFIGSVPDRERLARFYDTPARREEYERRSREGTEAIGTWWHRDELVALAQSNGFRCTILAQDPRLYTAHYRFDALLSLPGRADSV